MRATERIAAVTSAAQRVAQAAAAYQESNRLYDLARDVTPRGSVEVHRRHHNHVRARFLTLVDTGIELDRAHKNYKRLFSDLVQRKMLVRE